LDIRHSLKTPSNPQYLIVSRYPTLTHIGMNSPLNTSLHGEAQKEGNFIRETSSADAREA
jgi:hypothetical protein